MLRMSVRSVDIKRKHKGYDVTMISQITDNVYIDSDPTLNNNSTLVWNGKEDDSDYEIFIASPILVPEIASSMLFLSGEHYL